MRKIEELRQLQLVELSLLKDFTKFCDVHEIRYYLGGGCLIGAFRHKGFIPWDDDVDILMPRPDYEKLIGLSNGVITDKIIISDPMTTQGHLTPIPRVEYIGSKLVNSDVKVKQDLKINLELFIVDGLGKGKLSRLIQFKQIYFYKACLALTIFDIKRANSALARTVGPFLALFFKHSDYKKWLEKIMEISQRYPYETSECVAALTGLHREKELLYRERFEKRVLTDFEDTQVYISEDSRFHLTQLYGDYMKMPPKEQQRPKHGFEAWVEDSFF